MSCLKVRCRAARERSQSIKIYEALKTRRLPIRARKASILDKATERKIKAVNSETTTPAAKAETSRIKPKNIIRLKIFGVVLTLLGVGLFAYFIHSVGVEEILAGIGKIGFGGFAVILVIYFSRILMRALAWKLSVYAPYRLDLRDTLPAVIIGEAMSSMIPLGSLVSGTSKAVAVRKRVPLVVGLSSIATENLFYSFVTAVFIVL